MDLFKDNFRQHYANRRTMKPGKRRRRRFNYSRNTTVGRRSKRGMIAALSISTVAVAALVLVAIFVVIPAITSATTPVAAPPTDTPMNIHPADMTALQKEILMRVGTSPIPNASPPNVNGNEIVFSSGQDAIGQIEFDNIYVFNTADPGSGLQKVVGDTLKNDNILQTCIDENRIVWFDAKDGGGGTIYAYDRKAKTTTAIKTSYFGEPKLNLYQNYVAWIEYAGTKDATMVDKLYIYDLVSGENTTLELYRNSPTAPGGAYIDEAGDLVWATAKPDNSDTSDTEEDKPVTCLINTVKLGLPQEQTKVSQFDPGMYVYRPMTNGTVTIWTDTNGVPPSPIWASISGQAPEKIAEGTTQYGMGKDFVAYTKDQKLYAYFFEDKRTCKLADDAQLGAVRGNTVVWFKVGTEIAQSILRYAVIDS